MPIRPPALHRPERPRRRTRPAALLLVAGVAVVLAGLGACSTIRVFTDFSGVLGDAGFTDVAVTIDSGGAETLVVSASAPGGDSLEEAHDQAAELVWTRFPRRFEDVRITIDGERREHTRARLREEYGPRPAALDETDLTDEVTRFGITALLTAVIGGLLVVVAVVVTVLLVVRARRRRRDQATGGPGPLAPTGGPPLTPWMPPGAHAGAPDPSPVVGPPPSSLPPGPPPDVAPAARPGPDVTGQAGATGRGLGRRPRGPVPPPSQTPPGWER